MRRRIRNFDDDEPDEPIVDGFDFVPNEDEKEKPNPVSPFRVLTYLAAGIVCLLASIAVTVYVVVFAARVGWKGW